MKKSITHLCLLLLSLSLLVACSKHEDKSKEKKLDPLEIIITPDIQKQIKTEVVRYQEISETLMIPGRLETQNRRLAKIGSPIVGRVSDLYVSLGDIVKKGQVLARVNSIELTQTQLTLIKSTQLIGLKTKAVERAKLLFEADVISKAEMLRIENELEAVKADYRASRDQLMVLGMSEKAVEKLEASGQINSFGDIRSLFDGIIISRAINVGQIVNPQDNLFHIADLSKLWAVANIPEQQASFIQKDEVVSIEIPALDNKQIEAKIVFEDSIVDPQTRTVMVRAELDNLGLLFKPDMLTSMYIRSKKISKLAIPISSVVRENDRKYVLVQNTPKTFRLREVELGMRDGNLISIISGLSEGETVVTDGAFHLNSERKKKELE
ncbi:efflux RND transporter periplasmic adaptor subunit [Candidatus Methylopumilus rimovensis]|jgi:cobalt-zinc-cadmium efflux system membrane fusion protein|uniref:Efflux RND transporter periplasmic adaptor subunit n=1 Tax=Candidatus Methylopumilus rimovensis TaxID=2588535 RepID=A0AAE6KNK6_9PROT|nr:efflux RND transporter periplasmic adaptor subunit [Candidatus Methylopumilus rimovensis]QDD12959.1 efflux RND transporter periplasmic adaptor subunit [Candidatus Methylopumilus rimovensis]